MAATDGHINLGRTVAGAALTGGLSLLIGGSHEGQSDNCLSEGGMNEADVHNPIGAASGSPRLGRERSAEYPIGSHAISCRR